MTVNSPIADPTSAHTPDSSEPPKYPTALSLRLAARVALFRGPTAGHAPRHVQANLLIVPARYAPDFRGLCARNPVACPLVAESAPGDPGLGPLATDADVRTDAPGYNVYRDGRLIQADVPDCKAFWADDSVAFLIGCSFTFEHALAAAGLVPRHVKLGLNVPMYKTRLPLMPSGVFSGNVVVSMRPYAAADVPRVRQLTRPFIAYHGEPIAWGPTAPAALGIADLLCPDYGDAPVLRAGDVPVFWGCGVTPQAAALAAGLEGVWVGHAPGKMLVLDLLDADACAARGA
ncbi:hypothetical protein Q5752_001671 [Cryptotrichosporon argae]